MVLICHREVGEQVKNLDKNDCGAVEALSEKVILVKEHEKRFFLLDLFFLEGFALNFEDDFIFDMFFLFLFRFF